MRIFSHHGYLSYLSTLSLWLPFLFPSKQRLVENASFTFQCLLPLFSSNVISFLSRKRKGERTIGLEIFPTIGLFPPIGSEIVSLNRFLCKGNFLLVHKSLACLPINCVKIENKLAVATLNLLTMQPTDARQPLKQLVTKKIVSKQSKS